MKVGGTECVRVYMCVCVCVCVCVHSLSTSMLIIIVSVHMNRYVEPNFNFIFLIFFCISNYSYKNALLELYAHFTFNYTVLCI